MISSDAVNYNVPVGTAIKFHASARLRAIVDNVMKQSNLNEGALIGEGRTGKVLARVANGERVAYVVETDTNHYGWCFNFEFLAAR